MGRALLEQALVVAPGDLAPPLVGVVPGRGGQHGLLVAEVHQAIAVGGRSDSATSVAAPRREPGFVRLNDLCGAGDPGDSGTLAERYAFREVSYLIGAGATGLALSQRDAARVQQLCAYGQRLFDLDAEDLANPDAAPGPNTDTTFAHLVGDELVPAHLLARGRRCHVRQQSRPPDRRPGLPAARLPAAAGGDRSGWQRQETLPVLAAVHIASEYAPLLAWEPAAGPRRRPGPACGPTPPSPAPAAGGAHDDPRCPHTNGRAAAGRALRVAGRARLGLAGLLDRQHSLVSHALAARPPCP